LSNCQQIVLLYSLDIIEDMIPSTIPKVPSDTWTCCSEKKKHSSCHN